VFATAGQPGCRPGPAKLRFLRPFWLRPNGKTDIPWQFGQPERGG
jgi:hypothetical protein